MTDLTMKPDAKITIETTAGRLAAVMTAVATKDVRYYLNGIAFEGLAPGGVRMIATDGHRLMKVESMVDNWKGPRPVESIIISFDKETQAVIRKAANRDEWVSLHFDMEGADVEVKFRGLNMTHRAKRLDGKFPDWAKIMPPVTNEVKESAFNAAYMVDVAKAQKALCSHKTPTITLSPRGDSAMLITFNNLESGIEAVCVIMPMRV